MNDKLRIAVLPHLGRPISPNTNAARSRIIYELIEQLALRGHKISLLGTKDSQVPAEIIPVAPTGVFLMEVTENDFYRHVSYLTQTLKILEKRQQEFDVVHSHMYPEFLPLLLGPQLKIPLLTTIHTEMTPYLVDGLKVFPEANLVALSERHKQDAKDLNIKYVVHNGIDIDHFKYSPQAQDYFLFVGRIKVVEKTSGELYDPKGVLTAISVAKQVNVKLKISGSIENPSMYEKYIKPHLSDKIQFIGKVSKEAPLTREQMVEMYQGAKALIFPIHWEEPFGLVIVEANACGTPVIALNRGSVPELIQNGVNGFIANNELEMVQAVSKIDSISREKCRKAVEDQFTKQKMAENYELIYRQLVKGKV